MEQKNALNNRLLSQEDLSLYMELQQFDEHTVSLFSLMAADYLSDAYDDYSGERKEEYQLGNQILYEFKKLEQEIETGSSNKREKQRLLYYTLQDIDDDELIRGQYKVPRFLKSMIRKLSLDEYLFYIDYLNNNCWDNEKCAIDYTKICQFQIICSMVTRKRTLDGLQAENNTMEEIKNKALLCDYEQAKKGNARIKKRW